MISINVPIELRTKLEKPPLLKYTLRAWKVHLGWKAGLYDPAGIEVRAATFEFDGKNEHWGLLVSALKALKLLEE